MEQIVEEYGVGIVLFLIGLAVISALSSIFFYF